MVSFKICHWPRCVVLPSASKDGQRSPKKTEQKLKLLHSWGDEKILIRAAKLSEYLAANESMVERNRAKLIHKNELQVLGKVVASSCYQTLQWSLILGEKCTSVRDLPVLEIGWSFIFIISYQSDLHAQTEFFCWELYFADKCTLKKKISGCILILEQLLDPYKVCPKPTLPCLLPGLSWLPPPHLIFWGHYYWILKFWHACLETLQFFENAVIWSQITLVVR